MNEIENMDQIMDTFRYYSKRQSLDDMYKNWDVSGDATRKNFLMHLLQDAEREAQREYPDDWQQMIYVFCGERPSDGVTLDISYVSRRSIERNDDTGPWNDRPGILRADASGWKEDIDDALAEYGNYLERLTSISDKSSTKFWAHYESRYLDNLFSGMANQFME